MSTDDPPFSTTTAMSALDKPLHQLTEDDISQLTREDCRRYLKQKGMRRPSWNKSQAIQQVIMLKSLLEPAPESGDRGRKLYITPRQHQTPTTRVQKGTSADTEISLSAEESVPGPRKETEKTELLGENDSAHVPAHVPAHVTGPWIGGGTEVTEVTKGQMTIFYSGKAHALLQLAASPLQFPQEGPVDANMLQGSSIHVGPDIPDMVSPILQTVRMTDNHRLHREESNILREETYAEGSASRKASVQRYLEKRKDRFKSKRKVGAPTFDAYVNHQTGNHNLQDRSSRSVTCSPPPLRPPNTPNRFS
ncbi:protein TIFY 4B-like isoform X2 [Rutidosis leptorrhynchoides]|uniref:protein TIFY 4B-like isoform X2 n=1 Tax=Rutidosis leptorrhynchoides TaxID=125765 RepID=UPI003A98FDBA